MNAEKELFLRDVFPSAQGGSNSVRYFAASFPAFFLKAAWAVWSSFGGGERQFALIKV
jgi:hypothetical protein